MMSEWQPIETAPRDGRNLLLWDADSQSHEIALWSEPHQLWAIDYTDSMPPSAHAKVSPSNTCYVPTHWMPLPTPPHRG